MRWSLFPVGLLLLCLAGCTTLRSSCHGCQPSRKLVPQVIFHTDSKKIAVKVELACTPNERAQGLMYRKSMGPFNGMLFVFPSEEIQGFWMKNTFIALDMIHLNKDKEIVGVVENATPHTLTSRKISTPSIYVIEVNAYFARRHQIRIGQKVEFVDIPSC